MAVSFRQFAEETNNRHQSWQVTIFSQVRRLGPAFFRFPSFHMSRFTRSLRGEETQSLAGAAGLRRSGRRQRGGAAERHPRADAAARFWFWRRRKLSRAKGQYALKVFVCLNEGKVLDPNRLPWKLTHNTEKGGSLLQKEIPRRSSSEIGPILSKMSVCTLKRKHRLRPGVQSQIRARFGHRLNG